MNRKRAEKRPKPKFEPAPYCPITHFQSHKVKSAPLVKLLLDEILRKIFKKLTLKCSIRHGFSFVFSCDRVCTDVFDEILIATRDLKDCNNQEFDQTTDRTQTKIKTITYNSNHAFLCIFTHLLKAAGVTQDSEFPSAFVTRRHPQNDCHADLTVSTEKPVKLVLNTKTHLLTVSGSWATYNRYEEETSY